MTYRLFLDDYRFPSDGRYVIARSIDDAKWYVENWGMPQFISFDHDLADEHYADMDGDHEGTGFHFAKWLCERVMDGKATFPPNFAYRVHSMNPVGAENIRVYMRNFLNTWGK